MIALLFNMLVGFINGAVGLFLAPINLLVASAFPDFTNLVGNFSNFIDTYIGTPCTYFINILPPNTANLMLIYIDLLIIIWTFTTLIHYVMKAIVIIRNIKFW